MSRSKSLTFFPLRADIFNLRLSTIQWIVKIQRKHDQRNATLESIKYKIKDDDLRLVLKRIGREYASTNEAKWLIRRWVDRALQEETKRERLKLEQHRLEQETLEAKSSAGRRARKRTTEDTIHKEVDNRLTNERDAKKPALIERVTNQVRQEYMDVENTCCETIHTNAHSLAYHRRFDCNLLPILTCCPTCKCLVGNDSKRIRLHMQTCQTEPFGFHCVRCKEQGCLPSDVYHLDLFSHARHALQKHSDEQITKLILKRTIACPKCTRILPMSKAINHVPNCRKTLEWRQSLPCICMVCQTNTDTRVTFRGKDQRWLTNHNNNKHKDP